MLPVLAALVVAVPAGCADDVSPAIRIDDVAIGNDALLDEVAQWGGNPTLLQAVQFPTDLVEGSAPGSWSNELVGFVVGTRVGFELHRVEFEALGLEIDPASRDAVRAQLFGDPALTEQVLSEFTGDYGDELIDSVARQLAVEEALGEEYAAWVDEAYTEGEVEVNPRYGSWDAESGRVVPPEGPITRTTEPAFPAGG